MTKLLKKASYKKNYAVVSNIISQDKRLSWKSRGIFMYLWSLPNDWNYKERNISKEATDGIDSLKSGIKELRTEGYLNIKRFKSGHTAWVLSDKPIKTDGTPRSEKPHVENPHAEKPHVENPHAEKPHVENPLDLQSTHHYKVHTKQSTNIDERTSTIEQKLAFEFSYYKNQIHMQQLSDDVKGLLSKYPYKIVNKAVDTANDYQMKKRRVGYPVKFINAVCKNLQKNNKPVKDDIPVHNGPINWMARANALTRSAEAKLKKEDESHE